MIGPAQFWLERWLTRSRFDAELEKERARVAFYNGGGVQPPSMTMKTNGDINESDSGEEGGGLPFFMGVCAILAIGALIIAEESDADTHNLSKDPHSIIDEHMGHADFLFALSQQGVGVWEDWTRTRSRNEPNEEEQQDVLEADGYASPIRKEEQALEGDHGEEEDELTYIATLIIQVAFLVLEQGSEAPLSAAARHRREPNGESAHSDEARGVLFPLVNPQLRLTQSPF